MDTRCTMAESDGPDCQGAIDAVFLTDRLGTSLPGCVLHAAIRYSQMMGVKLRIGSDPNGVYRTLTIAKERRDSDGDAGRDGNDSS